MRLQNKVAVVAGGGQGIGEGIVLCLAEEGADIAVIDINGAVASNTAQRVKEMGRKSLMLVADLLDEKQTIKSVNDAVDFFGKIDILINNVGGTSEKMGKSITEHAQSNEELGFLPEYMQLSPQIWDQFYKLNLKTHVLMCQAITPRLIKQRRGKIVNIASIAGRLAEPGTNMAYAAVKASDISFTWSLAKALAPYNINVNCICPGHVYTPLWERGAIYYLNIAREVKKKGGNIHPILQPSLNDDLTDVTPKEFWRKYIVAPNTPTGREQTPEDIGRAVVFFVSEDAKNITGQVLNVDGGYVMR